MSFRLRTFSPLAYGLLSVGMLAPSAALAYDANDDSMATDALSQAASEPAQVAVDAAEAQVATGAETGAENTPTLPLPVKAMVDAVLATKDRAKIAAVIEIAKTTNPDHKAELDGYLSAFNKDQQVARAEAAAAAQEKLRQASFLQNWSGTGQIGGFHSAGNSDNAGLSLSLTLQRKGIDWRHLLRARMDFQEAKGVTSKEQYLFAYEPRYDIAKNVFSYALGQFEKDRFQGFSSRYSVSGGLGYRVLNGKRVSLTVQAGPAWRHTDYVAGGSDSNLAALFSTDFDWKITDRITFTQDSNVVSDAGGRATVIVEPNNTSLSLISGVDLKLNNRLSTRITYTLDYNSKPPVGSVSTDSLTRFTLAYGF